MTPKPPKPLAKWYSFAPYSGTQAFITPYVPRLRIVADPQDITIISRLSTYLHSTGEYRFTMPETEMVCYGIGMQRREAGPILLHEGTIVQFTEGVMARITNIHPPYWRTHDASGIYAGPSPVAHNTLLCYLGFIYLTPEEVTEVEADGFPQVKMLTAVDTLFD